MSLEEQVYQLTSLCIKSDTPLIENTAKIHPVLRNIIPGFQALKLNYLPWLFKHGEKILLKDDQNKLYLEWVKISFETNNNNPPVICQIKQESFINFVNIQYDIYEVTVNNEIQDRNTYVIQITVPMICGYGETDPWGIKKIVPRPMTLGGFILTGKGMQKYPVSIEDERPAWGQLKKKLANSGNPQFSFGISKDMILPYHKGQIPQFFKVILDNYSMTLDISCNNKNVELRLPEINIIILSAFLTNRSIDEVGESLKLVEYGEKTSEVHAIIDLLIWKTKELNEVPNYIESKLNNVSQVINNLMSQYNILTRTSANRRKGYMLEVQVRRMLMALYVPNYYPDRDSSMRKRYYTAGRYYEKIFNDRITEISNIVHSSRPMDRVKITKEIESSLTMIVSNINSDISTSTFDGKTGVWVHDSATSTLNSISRMTSCAKKLQKDITKDLGFRYYHSSQFLIQCPYDVPEHGENVGLTNTLSVISRIVTIYPDQKLQLVNELYNTTLDYLKTHVGEGNKNDYYVILDDMLLTRVNKKQAYELYYHIRHMKRHNQFSRRDFGVVLDPYLHEIRYNLSSGRIVQPILCVIDGELELLKVNNLHSEILNNSLDQFMDKYPDVIEFVDCDSIQVSSQIGGYICLGVAELMKKSLDERKKIDYCTLSSWAYFGWNINHRILCNYDEAIRNVFYCSLTKSGIHNKILAKNTFDSYHKSIYTKLPLYTNPVMECTGLGKLAIFEVLWVAIMPCNNGINQEDGIVVNEDSVNAGMLASLYVTKYNIEVSRDMRTCNTHKIILHSNQDKIHPVTGLPLLNSIIRKGDAIVRNFEQISTSVTGITHKDNSETYFDYSSGRVDQIIMHPDKPNIISLLIVSLKTITNGDKFSSGSAQKCTAVSIVRKTELPCTPDGMYPNIVMSPTGILARKTLSMITSVAAFVACVLKKSDPDPEINPYKSAMRIRMGPIEENYDWIKTTEETTNMFDRTRKMHDSWKGQSSKNLANSSYTLLHPSTNEIMENCFFAPYHYLKSRHLVNSKKSVCSKGRISEDTRQTTSKRKSGGAAKFDEMSRNVVICYGAAHTLRELLSEPEDRRESVYICVNCGGLARYIDNVDDPYYMCDICINRFNNSKVIKLNITYAARKFLEYSRARGIMIKLHPKKVNEEYVNY